MPKPHLRRRQNNTVISAKSIFTIALSAPEIDLKEWTKEELVEGARYVHVFAVLMSGNLPADRSKSSELYFEIHQPDTSYDKKIIRFEVKDWVPVHMIPRYISKETGDVGEVAKIKYMTMSIDPQTQQISAWLDMIELKSTADMGEVERGFH